MRDDNELNRDQLRFERFAAIRAARPEASFDDIMEEIHDDETNEAEAALNRASFDCAYSALGSRCEADYRPWEEE